MINVAIFCSGSGSNAEALMAHFQEHETIRVALVVTNKIDAFARTRAEKFGVPSVFLSRKTFAEHPESVLETLETHQISFVLLAGFLQIIPPLLVDSFTDRILNIHPALLPKFGGEGMYGHFVHEAVVAAGETESGITIHFVNKEYDKGKIIFQAQCPVEKENSPTDIAARVLKLEHHHYPIVAEFIIQNSGLKPY